MKTQRGSVGQVLVPVSGEPRSIKGAPMMPLRLIRLSASIDELMAYLIDANPVIRQHLDWITAEHPSGLTFANALEASGKELQDRSAESTREHLEAVEATAFQQEKMNDASALIGKISRFGVVLSKEFAQAGDLEQASQVRKATECGRGNDRRSQVRLRGALGSQLKGIAKLDPSMNGWARLSGYAQEGVVVLDALDKAYSAQSQESVEDKLARDRLTFTVTDGAALFNRAISFINVDVDDAPQTLVASLRAIEGQHPSAFHPRVQGAGEVELAPQDDPEAEAELEEV